MFSLFLIKAELNGINWMKYIASDTVVNINWWDVQTKNVVNNVDMSSVRAPWQNGPYKN